MGKPGVKSIEQLKGGTLAISRFGSATDSIARFALKKVGLSVGKDVTLIQVGSGPERLGALQTGRVTAAVINPPSTHIADNRGMAALADVAQLRLVLQLTGAATTKKFMREHNDVVRRYVRAHVEAVHKMWTDKEATIRALGKYMGSGLDREILEKSWANVMHETLYPRKQYPSVDGLKTVIDDLAERDPRAKNAKPEQFIDASFIRELDQSGFIDGLYKK
jgi:NitT/TauT family transport system substrate-binding protein